MKVIGHNHIKRVNFDQRELTLQLLPPPFHHFSGGIWLENSRIHLPQQTFMFLDANSDKVSAFGGIVKSF